MCALGTSSRRLGGVLGRLGRVLDASWGVLARLGRVLAGLGRVLEASFGHLVRSGTNLKQHLVILAKPRKTMEIQWFF